MALKNKLKKIIIPLLIITHLKNLFKKLVQKLIICKTFMLPQKCHLIFMTTVPSYYVINPMWKSRLLLNSENTASNINYQQIMLSFQSH